MNLKRGLVLITMLCIFNFAKAQRYFSFEVGPNYVMPKAEVKTVSKPGLLMNVGISSEFSERFTLRSGVGISIYAFDFIGYERVDITNYYSNEFKFSEQNIRQTCFHFNYDILFNFYIIKEKLALIAGPNVGFFSYVGIKTYEKETYFTKDKVDQNKVFNNIDLTGYEFVNNPTFDSNMYLFGPKFGISFSPSTKIEFNILYTLFLNSFYSDDDENISNAIGDFKINFLQVGFVYKLKPSPSLKRF